MQRDLELKVEAFLNIAKIDITPRCATIDDVSNILLLLTAVAPEIPLLLDTQERCRKIEEYLREWVGYGESCVVVDNSGQVIGFLLVRPDEDNFFRKNKALHLAYAGVAENQRGRGIFRALIAHMLGRNVPLTATVKAQNKSGMVKRLRCMNFEEISARGDGQESRFIWKPNAIENRK